MPKIKTVEMSGAALDWAVATATQAAEIKISANCRISCIFQDSAGGCLTSHYQPSTRWDECGLLIDRYHVMVHPSLDIETETVLYWVAVFETYSNRAYRVGWIGDTPEIAICRAVVGNLLGAEVDVPAELEELA